MLFTKDGVNVGLFLLRSYFSATPLKECGLIVLPALFRHTEYLISHRLQKKRLSLCIFTSDNFCELIRSQLALSPPPPPPTFSLVFGPFTAPAPLHRHHLNCSYVPPSRVRRLHGQAIVAGQGHDAPGSPHLLLRGGNRRCSLIDHRSSTFKMQPSLVEDCSSWQLSPASRTGPVAKTVVGVSKCSAPGEVQTGL